MAELVVPSRTSVDKAGRILRDPDASSEDYRSAVDTLSQWRRLHTFPINTFVSQIRRLTERAFPNAIVAQRLKRFASIVGKLERYPDMSLARMQDIGGVRVILNSISDVHKLYRRLVKDSSHEPLLPPFDYIRNPKPDGYRSIHQVFKYKSRDYPQLNGIRVEVQIRSKLQHAWATAVETFDIIENSSLKTGNGHQEAHRYFKLVSVLFAHDEKTEIMEEFKCSSPRRLVEEIQGIDSRLHITNKISGVAHTIKHIMPDGTRRRNQGGYFLMQLDMKENSIQLIPFTTEQASFAEELYSLQEQGTKGNADISLVLLNAGSIQGIKKAYPNYFLDAHSFLKNLDRVCSLYK